MNNPKGQKRDDCDSTSRKQERFPVLERHHLQNIVHELSSPLTPILGYLKLFNNGALGELTSLQSRSISGILNSAMRLSGTLDDLSNFLQMESGIYRFSSARLPIDTLIRKVLDKGPTVGQKENIEVILEAQDCDLSVLGDENKLLTALRHLLSNGLKFNGAGGKLMICVDRVQKEEGYVIRTKVLDTGIGISADDIERVFEPFFQADHSTTRRFQGAGLGLPIARWIIEGHGGTITLESPPSEQPEGHFFRGVEATVELPAAEVVSREDDT